MTSNKLSNLKRRVERYEIRGDRRWVPHWAIHIDGFTSREDAEKFMASIPVEDGTQTDER